MSARVEMQGLRELVTALRALPQTLRDEGVTYVREATEGTASEVAHRYPSVTGNLSQSVRTSYPSSAGLVGEVRVWAPHSHLYEFGTKARRTRQGWPRGRMPAARVIVPIAQRYRERMFQQLLALVARSGFQVTIR